MVRGIHAGFVGVAHEESLEAGGLHLVKSSFVAFWHAQRAAKG